MVNCDYQSKLKERTAGAVASREDGIGSCSESLPTAPRPLKEQLLVNHDGGRSRAPASVSFDSACKTVGGGKSCDNTAGGKPQPTCITLPHTGHCRAGSFPSPRSPQPATAPVRAAPRVLPPRRSPLSQHASAAAPLPRLAPMPAAAELARSRFCSRAA